MLELTLYFSPKNPEKPVEQVYSTPAIVIINPLTSSVLRFYDKQLIMNFHYSKVPQETSIVIQFNFDIDIHVCDIETQTWEIIH